MSEIGVGLVCDGLTMAAREFELRISLACDKWPLVLLGPSGAGKSLFLRILAGLTVPPGGRVVLGKETTSDGEGPRTWLDSGSSIWLPAHLRRIGYCQQDPALFPHLSVVENVEYPLGSRRPRIRSHERRERALAELKTWGVESLAGARVGEISGGEQARVALARAFVADPQLLLLDEPFSSLDPLTREELTQKVSEHLRARGTAAVWVTHDREEAMILGRTVAVLQKGRVEQIGPPEEIFRLPSSPEVAAFVGIGSILHGLVQARESGVMRILCGPVTLRAAGTVPPGTAVVVLVRSEDVELLPGPDHLFLDDRSLNHPPPNHPVPERAAASGARSGSGAMTSARNEISATVVALRPQGLTVAVDLDAGVALVATVTKPAAQDLGLRPGLPVLARVKAVAVRVRTEVWEA